MTSYSRFNKPEREKFICENCGIEKNETNYYLSHNPEHERMNICKSCFENEIIDTKDRTGFLGVFKKYDIPFLINIWDSCEDNLSNYMKTINSLPQYKNLTWKDSIIEKEDVEQENNFYNDIVSNLKKEADKINKILVGATNRCDMQTYIASIKSLRETLDLIQKYDWKLMYSEYTTLISDKDSDRGKLGNEVRQVAIWEQNQENQIRNHKVWTIE